MFVSAHKMSDYVVVKTDNIVFFYNYNMILSVSSYIIRHFVTVGSALDIKCNIEWFYLCSLGCRYILYFKKVKQSHYRPGVAQKVPVNSGFQFMTTQDGGKVVSLTHRPLFTPRKCAWYSLLLEAESNPGP